MRATIENVGPTMVELMFSYSVGFMLGEFHYQLIIEWIGRLRAHVVLACLRCPEHGGRIRQPADAQGRGRFQKERAFLHFAAETGQYCRCTFVPGAGFRTFESACFHLPADGDRLES